MKKIFLLLIRFYQLVISPLTPPCCRYTPTCSQYAMEAIERYGLCRGGLMGLRRILRCHPFCQGGYDPVEHKVCGSGKKQGHKTNQVTVI